MKTYLDGWNANGGGLFMYFVLASGYSKYGSWGLTDDITKSSPKYEAALQVVQAPRVPLTAGALVPGEVKAGDFEVQNKWHKKGEEQITLDKDVWLGYLVRVPKTGKYKISAQAASDTGDAQLEVLVNSKSLGKLTAPKRDGETLIDTEAVSADLEAGLNVVRLQGVAGRVQVKSFSVSQ